MEQSRYDFVASECLMDAERQTKPLLIVLLGPTASGKTRLAIEIAEKLRINVLNIDSRQLYKGMDIGTAKPTQEQQKRVNHLLLDLRPPDQPITLQEFKEVADPLLNKDLELNGVSFLVGGSGLYLKALISGFDPPAVPPQIAFRKQIASLGQETCHSLLSMADPQSAKRISKADAMRTQRALEVLYATGQTMTSQRKKNAPSWRILELGLDPINLTERIVQRTNYLYANGLLEEVEALIYRFGTDLPLLQTIGYGEALQFLNGEISKEKAIAITNRRTQQFAKRQRTWFRGQHKPHWLNDEEPLREAMSLIQVGLGWS